MNTINSIIDRARVVLTAAVTWISAAVVVVQFILANETVASVPEVAQYGSQAVAFLVGVIAIIRRVTPVAPEERGLV